MRVTVKFMLTVPPTAGSICEATAIDRFVGLTADLPISRVLPVIAPDALALVDARSAAKFYRQISYLRISRRRAEFP